jgi:hypothetical protein
VTVVTRARSSRFHIIDQRNDRVARRPLARLMEMEIAMYERSTYANRIGFAFARTFGASFAALTLLVVIWSVVSVS